MSTNPEPLKPPTIKQLTVAQIDEGIEKLQARIDEVHALQRLSDPRGQGAGNLAQAIRVAILETFGPDSIEFRDCADYDIWAGPRSGTLVMHMDGNARREAVRQGLENAEVMLAELIKRLEERKKYQLKRPGADTQKAFDNVTLHPRIDAAAAKLFRDGHYKQSVFEATIALQNAVKEKAHEHVLDGTGLMEKIFNHKAPVLALTPCATQDEQNEQRGWMFLYAGAIQALRNPRGHSHDQDKPETALACLVFLSFLAQTLEQATLKP